MGRTCTVQIHLPRSAEPEYVAGTLMTCIWSTRILIFILEGNEGHGIEAIFARSFWFGGTIMYSSTAIA